MKKLVIYYSLSGNTKFIAENIAKAIDADILVLKPKKELKNKGFMKYLWGGRQVVMKIKPELLPFDKDPKEYDLIFIGTPVWSFNYTPPIRTFLSVVKLKNKKIALFCCHGGAKGKTFENMKKILNGNEIIGEIDFFEPLRFKKEINKNKAVEWAREVLKNEN